MPPNFPTMFMLSSLYRFCFLFAKFGLFSDLGQRWFWQYLYFLERAMATHSRVLAWRIPGTVEPGGLRSMRSHRVGHNWSNLAVAAAYVSMFLWRDEHLELLISLFFWYSVQFSHSVVSDSLRPHDRSMPGWYYFLSFQIILFAFSIGVCLWIFAAPFLFL